MKWIVWICLIRYIRSARNKSIVAHQVERFVLAGGKSTLAIAQAIAYLSGHYSLRDIRIEESRL